MASDVIDILMRLVVAGLLGACIGFARRIYLAELDPSSISLTLQGFLFGIAFLSGAVIFKSGFGPRDELSE